MTMITRFLPSARRVVAALAASWVVVVAWAEDLPTLFVAPLDGDRSAIMAWQPAMGEGLAEMLITELTKTGKFQVLESTALKELASEIDLGAAGYVAEDEKVEKGGWAGADFMFRGKVTRFGSKQQSVGLGGVVPGALGRVGVGQRNSDVRIDWRIVDVATRRIIVSGEAVGEEKGLNFDLSGGGRSGFGGVSYRNQEFMNSALGKATVKALNAIVGQVTEVTVPESGRRQAQQKKAAAVEAKVTAAVEAKRKTPGTVLAVVGADGVVISLGSDHGFAPGDTLKAYRLNEIKDDTGAVVFTEEEYAGEVVLDSVQAGRSRGRYTGTVKVVKGWVVKVD